MLTPSQWSFIAPEEKQGLSETYHHTLLALHHRLRVLDAMDVAASFPRSTSLDLSTLASASSAAAESPPEATDNSEPRAPPFPPPSWRR